MLVIYATLKYYGYQCALCSWWKFWRQYLIHWPSFIIESAMLKAT